MMRTSVLLLACAVCAQQGHADREHSSTEQSRADVDTARQGSEPLARSQQRKSTRPSQTFARLLTALDPEAAFHSGATSGLHRQLTSLPMRRGKTLMTTNDYFSNEEKSTTLRNERIEEMTQSYAFNFVLITSTILALGTSEDIEYWVIEQAMDMAKAPLLACSPALIGCYALISLISKAVRDLTSRPELVKVGNMQKTAEEIWGLEPTSSFNKFKMRLEERVHLGNFLDQVDTDASGGLDMDEFKRGLFLCGIRDIDYEAAFVLLDKKGRDELFVEDLHRMPPQIRRKMEEKLNAEGQLDSLYIKPESAEKLKTSKQKELEEEDKQREFWEKQVQAEAMTRGDPLKQQQILDKQVGAA